MGMPQVPERDNLPSIKEVVIQILESVALEELAMAHIINAEGEKMQAIVKEISEKNLCCSCIQSLFKNTHSTLNSLIMKEWVMLTKLSTTLEIYNNFEDDCEHTACKSCKTCNRTDCKHRY